MNVSASVISMGPKFGGLAYSFLKGGTGEIKPLPPYHPRPHIWGGFPGQCVHTTANIAGEVMRCEQTGSSKSSNGYLCGYHQIICDPMTFDQRKRAQQAYMNDRDFDTETVDSIISHESRMIGQLEWEGKIMSVGRGLLVEKDRSLVPLPTGIYDSVWNDINMGTLIEESHLEGDDLG